MYIHIFFVNVSTGGHSPLLRIPGFVNSSSNFLWICIILKLMSSLRISLFLHGWAQCWAARRALCCLFFFLPRLELRSSIDRDSLASHCVLISGLPKDGRQTNWSKKRIRKRRGKARGSGGGGEKKEKHPIDLQITDSPRVSGANHFPSLFPSLLVCNLL